MKTKTINPNNISKNQVNDTITRVKAFIFNGDYLYLDKIDWGFMLPGGHVENNEDFDLALIREVEEETGMKLDKQDEIKKFYTTEKFTKNYKGTGRNRLNRIVYYLVKTNKTPNCAKINLTKDEFEHDLKVVKINKADFEKTLHESIENEIDAGFTVIANEMLDAYQVLKQEFNINQNFKEKK